MGLCLILVVILVFFPFYYYSSGIGKQNSNFKVGIHYVFEQDQEGQIYGQVTKLHNLGFTTIRITLECVPDEPDNTMNLKTDEFFSAASHYRMPVALVIGNDETAEKINYYLDRWGNKLTYIQVMNEPELSSSLSAWSLRPRIWPHLKMPWSAV